MSKDKGEELTWFEPFSEKEASNNEGSGLLRRFLKRPQRSSVEIDAKKQNVKFENSAVENKSTSNRVSSSEAESTGGEGTSTTAVYSTPPRTLSTVIDRFDTLGRSKVSRDSLILYTCAYAIKTEVACRSNILCTNNIIVGCCITCNRFLTCT